MKIKRIYILTDDIFFSLGMVALLSAAGYEPFVIDCHTQQINIDECHVQPCIVIVDIHQRERLQVLRRKNIPSTTKLVFVTSYQGYKNSQRGFLDIFIPRRISSADVCYWLAEYLRIEHRICYQLTHCEELIFHLLMEGHSPSIISEQLNLSVKRISQHKANILCKLGIKRMNDKSLFYLSEYIYKTVFFNSVSEAV